MPLCLMCVCVISADTNCIFYQRQIQGGIKSYDVFTFCSNVDQSRAPTAATSVVSDEKKKRNSNLHFYLIKLFKFTC